MWSTVFGATVGKKPNSISPYFVCIRKHKNLSAHHR